jgi:4,5-dihydroxyphthalate decarboxylase
MAKLRLNLACWNYNRTGALADGSVQPDGIDLNYLDLPVEEPFFRMLCSREFEVAELSLSSYTVSLFAEQRPFIAIPSSLPVSSGTRASTSTPTPTYARRRT